LYVIDREMGKTVENTSGAVKELKEAELRQKNSYKTIASLIIFAVVVLTLTIVSF